MRNMVHDFYMCENRLYRLLRRNATSLLINIFYEYLINNKLKCNTEDIVREHRNLVIT